MQSQSMSVQRRFICVAHYRSPVRRRQSRCCRHNVAAAARRGAHAAAALRLPVACFKTIVFEINDEFGCVLGGAAGTTPSEVYSRMHSKNAVAVTQNPEIILQSGNSCHSTTVTQFSSPILENSN